MNLRPARPVNVHRTRVRAIRLVAAPLLLAVAVTSSCSGDDSSASTTTEDTVAPTTAAPGPPPGATEEGLRSLEVGQCFDLPTDDPEAEDRAVWLIACTDPHTHEVFDLVEYGGTVPKGGGYPGEATVQDWAEQACFDRFEPFVGLPWTRSALEIEVWWPSEESWGRTDRTVLCTVFPETGGRVTGTLRGSER